MIERRFTIKKLGLLSFICCLFFSLTIGISASNIPCEAKFEPANKEDIGPLISSKVLFGKITDRLLSISNIY